MKHVSANEDIRIDLSDILWKTVLDGGRRGISRKNTQAMPGLRG